MVWGSTLAGVMAFIACSFYPMWWAYRADAWCIWGCNGSLWRMLLAVNDPEKVIEWQDGAVKTAVTVHIATIAGASIGGIRWKRKPADRVASESGLVPDSRAFDPTNYSVQS